MTSGMAAACPNANTNTESIRKVNLILFDCQVKFLNFSANNSNGETSKNDESTIMVIKAQG
jgi:hypothetical protein